MISHKDKCIFIHQRKCAGISIMDAFGMSPDNPDRHFMNDGVLSREYHDRPDYFTFSIVRNPWDRFISGWLYCEGTRNRTMRDVLFYLPKFEHDYVHITRLQRDILFNHTGYLMLDKLMRFETIQEDFDEVCDRIGKERVELKKLNRNPVLRSQDPVERYREYFNDPIDRDLFEKHFYQDIDTFGYRF